MLAVGARKPAGRGAGQALKKTGQASACPENQSTSLMIDLTRLG